VGDGEEAWGARAAACMETVWELTGSASLLSSTDDDHNHFSSPPPLPPRASPSLLIMYKRRLGAFSAEFEGHHPPVPNPYILERAREYPSDYFR